MAEYSANATQTVNPGESVVFTISPVPCNRGFIRWRPNSGVFNLSGWTPRRPSCGCRRENSAIYAVSYGANIAVPTGETVGAISLALAIDGVTLNDSITIESPAAVEEYDSVSKTVSVPVWNGCCQTVTLRNISTIPILVQNPVINFSRPDLAVTY